MIPISLMTRDHLIPTAHGGSADWTNIVLACHKCNEARATLHSSSIRHQKWLRRVLRGRVHRFIRRETFVHNAT